MSSLLIFFSYFLIILIVYGGLFFTFFQQDEWVIFSNFIYWDKAHLDWFQALFGYSKTHVIPLSNLVSYFQFKLLGLNFFFYGVSAVLIHLINSFFVYYLSLLLTRKRLLAVLVGFLFLTNSIYHQGFTWVATTIGTAGSTFFILISLIFFTKYVSEKGKNIQYSILSFVFFIISLFLKETSIFLFLFYPVFWFLYRENKNFIISIKFFLPFFVSGFLYILMRIYFLISGVTSTSAGVEYSQPHVAVYLYRIFTFPLKFIAQSILPQEFVIKIADSLIILGYPFHPNFFSGNKPNPYISQSIGVDIVSYFFSVSIILISIVLYRYFNKQREDYINKVLVLSILFIALSSFPFIFIPGSAGYFSLIEGRHLYISGVFTSILLGVVGFKLYIVLNRKRGIALILIAICVLLSIFHIGNVRRYMDSQMDTASVRKSILNTVFELHPNLPKKVVFYIESDKAYYGLPEGENIIPFQSGFGQTLLVWYNAHTDSFPACFFEDKFFYVLLNEGYRECEGRGFGYYRKLTKLKLAIKENNLTKESVIGFRFNSQTNSLVEITNQIRNNL